MLPWVFLLFLPVCCWAETYCFFTPPPKWEIADPKIVSRRTLFAFLDTTRSGFCPSLNLTKEEISISPESYLKIIEENAKRKRQRWRHLGKLETVAGPAELTEIEVKTQFGKARLMQLILFHHKSAYILTAGALKKEFGQHAAEIEKAMRSLTVTTDLFSQITEPALRSSLREAWQKKVAGLESKSFEKGVLEECSSLGTPWQILMLKL